MPRYFFHFQTRDELIEDPDGAELPGPDAARSEALWTGRELWAEACRAGRDLEVQAVVIADEEGHPVISVPLGASLPQRLRRT
jgi:hypothetical protein